MATPTSYVPLEGGFMQSVGGTIPSFNGASPSLFTSTSFLYTLFFVVIVVVASTKYAQAGLFRMEASQHGITKSNEIFKKTTLGLVGVFSLWLILSTVNKDLLSGDVGLDKLRSTGGAIPAGSATKPVTGINNPPIPANNDDPEGWDAIRNDSAIRGQLRGLSSGGITVNKTVCNNPTQTSCTTVGGLHSDTISMLTQLRNNCSGEIEITGGSENGHSSHGVGKTPVDLSINKPGGLNNCIRSFPATTIPSFCKNAYTKFGYTFCDEKGTPHWHVYK